ncbi:MAG: type III-B CRISPR module RAMP protein Cmr6 [Thermaceae bacterium]|nr:type III-B CRISPR module RAMP protein Cmr6 [Thermaceae bacterium]
MLNTHEKPTSKEIHPYTALISRIADLKVSPVYAGAFNRWKAALPGAVLLEATTSGPLAIGLGNASPIEVGLAIQHTYGTPYLPGSAIKGLLVRVAQHYGLDEEQKKVLFGTTENAAHIVYWDGWLDPASQQPFQLDVITVHHQSYYGSRGESRPTDFEPWPTDFDDPNPVAFLSVKPGTKFVLAISSNSENSADWVVRAAEMLEWALENLGLGGKTNAGYGYFGDFKVTVPERPKSPKEQAEEAERQTREVLGQAKDASSLSKIDDYLPKLEALEPVLRKTSLEAIKDHLTTMKRWDLEKRRCKRIQALLEET